MAFRPNRRHYNAAYDPWYTKIDWRVKCTVCSFAGIDPERTQEPERAVYSIEITEGIYQPVAGTQVDELARENVFFGDTDPPSGAPAHTTSNVAVFFGDSDPAANAPMHTEDNRPVYFMTDIGGGSAPLYVANATGSAFTHIGGGAGCPFCGSPNWSWAREPGLRW